MINLANSRVTWKFNSSVLAQKSSFSLYSNFVLNSYIAHELNNWLCNSSDSFPKGTCLFRKVKLIRKAIKRKFFYNGWGMLFDREGSWSFGNDFSVNVVIFGVAKCLSSHTDNWKKRLFSIRSKTNWWH